VYGAAPPPGGSHRLTRDLSEFRSPGIRARHERMDTRAPGSEAKVDLRRRLSEARGALSPADRAARSARIAQACSSLPGFATASILCAYVNFREEVETGALIDALLAAGRRVAVPVHLHGAPRPLNFAEIRSRAELVPNHFGIPQPPEGAARFLPTEAIPFFLVPGLAFDTRGGRLGYGLGFYDRAFAVADPAALKVGLAFEAQILERVPTGPHDVPMDFVVTEDRVIPAAPGAGAPTRRW
jgi:5-formyltetrahydrofolate cyclo-ligase